MGTDDGHAVPETMIVRSYSTAAFDFVDLTDEIDESWYK
jgi:hypothetical protein